MTPPSPPVRASGAPALSVIVPAFDEGPHVHPHLRRIVAVLETFGQSFEVLLVDDGSGDDTAAQARAAATDDPRIRVLSHARNQGKGAALATGCAAAEGETLVFLDADLDIAPEEVGPLVECLERARADVAVGSKYLPGARQRRPRVRTILSRLHLAVTSVLFRLPIRDTQTGLKALRREVARRLVPALSSRRFAFDVELLVLAHRAGCRIVAAPVTVDFRRAGVRIGWRGFVAAGVETLAVFVRDRALCAYGAVASRRRRRDARPVRFTLTGDDLGLSPGVDAGLLAAVAAGRLTAVSLLADGPTAETAAVRARALGADVGVHLDLVGDARGGLPGFLARTALGMVPPNRIGAAAAAAIARVRALGLAPTHVDAHRHAFLWPSTYRAVLRAARREGVRWVRRPAPLGALCCGAGPLGVAKGALLALVGIATRGLPRALGCDAPDGIVDADRALDLLARGRLRGHVEVVAHPAEGDDVPRCERGIDRLADARTLRDLRARLEAAGGTIVGFPPRLATTAP